MRRDPSTVPLSSDAAAPARLPLARIALWFLLTRLALWIVAGLAIFLIPRGSFDYHTAPAEWLNHWDAGWYLSIARHGYQYTPDAKSNVAFFPLFPLLARGLNTIVPNMLVSGYLISNSFLFASCLLLWKLVVRDYGSSALAQRAVLFLLLCPLTIFYSSFYTESLFLFLALSVAWFAGAGRWLAAGGSALLAAFTRPPGALLVIIIAVEYGFRLARRRRDPARPRVFVPSEALTVFLALLLPAAAFPLFGYYLYRQFGNPLILFQIHDKWGQHLAPPWNLVIAGFMYDTFYTVWFYAALFLAFFLLLRAFAYRLRPSHLAFLVAFMCLYSTNSLMEALPRYLSVLFPFYIVAAELTVRHPRLQQPLYIVSALLAILSIILFVDGYWYT